MTTTTDPTTDRVRAAVREHALSVSLALSAVALALVFAVALEFVPGGALPRAPDAVLDAIPHVNAAISASAAVVVVAGVALARRGAYDHHRRAMLLATGLFGLFLVLYLYRVALLGPAPFPGPESVYRSVYLPILAVHVTLAVVCVPLVTYVLVLATTHTVAELPDTPHERVGRVAASLWAVTFVLGVVVYAMLYAVY
ncbi:DUF420 domain-containing protein [Candidatus Halobonum tyrrellensis]|uniref:DUF420 domain-containing protein n=1 Tax=Candidatus Halobonum tyrrellensis TaxID=1431545 RepID=UPI000AF4E577|nr:DUF420 domain-containing protein [Candidatus Halobonum tyrrellensis]